MVNLLQELVHVKALPNAISNFSPNVLFFQNCACFDYLWLENMQRVNDRRGKDKKSKGHFWK